MGSPPPRPAPRRYGVAARPGAAAAAPLAGRTSAGTPASSRSGTSPATAPARAGLGWSAPTSPRAGDLDLVFHVGGERRWGPGVVLQRQGTAHAGDGAAAGSHLYELQAGSDVAGGVHAGDGGGAVGVDHQVPLGVALAAELLAQAGQRMVGDREEPKLALDRLATGQPDGAQVAAGPDQLQGRLLPHRDAVALEHPPVLGVALEPAPVGHHRDLAGPAEQLQGEADHLLAPADGDYRPALGLITVAGGTVEDAGPVVVKEPLHIRELVPDPGGQHQPARGEPPDFGDYLEAAVAVGRCLHRSGVAHVCSRIGAE